MAVKQAGPKRCSGGSPGSAHLHDAVLFGEVWSRDDKLSSGLFPGHDSSSHGSGTGGQFLLSLLFAYSQSNTARQGYRSLWRTLQRLGTMKDYAETWGAPIPASPGPFKERRGVADATPLRLEVPLSAQTGAVHPFSCACVCLTGAPRLCRASFWPLGEGITPGRCRCGSAYL